ncbi:glucokinase [Datura stramonium]|uniref:Glucokinase n=1 Tax=Datura stramonium TaxID=4076 RepID=A0ABS8V3V1_DATST|nr:glucokinase [Datura stramonium]
MLAVSPLSNTTARDERGNEMESFALGGGGGDDFPDFVGENLLDSIDFDDLFVGINDGHARKVKVDWTPELHRRFVQAVEQLGVDKAVHQEFWRLWESIVSLAIILPVIFKNIGHTKTLLAREAEATTGPTEGKSMAVQPPRSGGWRKEDINP